MVMALCLLLLLYLVKVRSDDKSFTVTTPVGEEAVSRPLKEVDWSYAQGTNQWCIQYEKCCGDAQSPIDFDTKSALEESFSGFNFSNYNTTPTELLLKNNGHTATVDLNFDGQIPSINNGGLGGVYEFASLHFHWGSTNEQGAEHTIDGLAYPLELHIVHFNSKYRSIDRAIENTDGLAVLGILFKIGQTNNHALNDIIENLNEIKYVDGSVTVVKVNLKLLDLLPSSTDQFFRYSGSLTTPKCQESVTWTVFEKIQTITISQLEKFRDLESGSPDDAISVPLVDNFRPVQELRGRRYRRRRGSESNVNQHSVLLVLITNLIILYLS